MSKRSMFLSAVLSIGLLALCLSGAALAGDPTGAETLQNNQAAPVDYVWVLVSGFLVFFMQAGFAKVEADFCRAKNTTNLLSKNLIDFVVASLGLFALGYVFLKGFHSFVRPFEGRWDMPDTLMQGLCPYGDD